MKNTSGKTTTIFTFILITLLCISLVGNSILGIYANTINHAFNIETHKVVQLEDNDNLFHFPSAYSENTLDSEGKTIYSEAGIQRLTEDLDSIGLELEGEGLVLLKNEADILPLSKGSKVSLFGQGSANFNYGSTGSSSASTSNYTNFKTAMEDAGFVVNPILWDFYTSGEGKDYQRAGGGLSPYTINEAPWELISDNTETSFPSYADSAIYVISRNSGEGSDLSTTGSDGANGNYLALSAEEVETLTELTNLKNRGVFSNIVILLNTSNPVQLDFLKDEAMDIDALLWIGNVGKNGINAVAQALCGDIVPSGRLSDTYVYNNFSSPAMASWILNEGMRFGQHYQNYLDYPSLNDTQNYYGVYSEGIYVGYRYYETRYEDMVLGSGNAGNYHYDDVVAYPFGYGLSYAEFEYEDIQITPKTIGGEKAFEISVTVRNVSDTYAGKEIVQIFAQKPYDSSTGLETASIELVGYAKTKIIQQNDVETVLITVYEEQLTSYDINANDGRGGYVLESGNYYLSIGKNAHDALNNVLTAKMENDSTLNQEEMAGVGDSKYTYSWNLSRRDEVSYAASKENGNLIQNQFDFSDINRYENRGDNEITYVSRNDWVGTFPNQAVTLRLTEGMVEDLRIHKDLPIDTTFETPVYGVDNGLSLIMLRGIEYDNSAWDTFLDQLTFEQQSLLLSNAAFGTVSLGSPINKPATADTDGPTGVVKSKTGSSFPSEGIWASSFNDDLIKRAGEMLAEDALYNGYQSLYATGINIHRTPYGGRAHEYFSEDPYLSGSAVCAEVQGMQSKGVIPTLKHFAFNDQEDYRGGISIWLNEQEAREIMLRPFEMAMRSSKGNAHAVMSSFNRVGCIWTSASSELMIEVVRDEWNFDGYSITDMAESFKFYMTYDDGIMNGTDLYLASGDEYSLADYAYSIPYRLSMREACHRVLYTICNYSAAMNGLSASSEIVTITPAWQIAVYGAIAVFGSGTIAGTGLWIIRYIRLSKSTNKGEIQ